MEIVTKQWTNQHCSFISCFKLLHVGLYTTFPDLLDILVWIEYSLVTSPWERKLNYHGNSVSSTRKLLQRKCAVYYTLLEYSNTKSTFTLNLYQSYQSQIIRRDSNFGINHASLARYRSSLRRWKTPGFVTLSLFAEDVLNS